MAPLLVSARAGRVVCGGGSREGGVSYLPQDIKNTDKPIESLCIPLLEVKCSTRQWYEKRCGGYGHICVVEVRHICGNCNSAQG